jgi:hypothetical protein
MATGVSAGVVGGGGVAGSMGAGRVVAAVVAWILGVGVAADWQPRKRTAVKRRVDNRFRFRITGMID